MKILLIEIFEFQLQFLLFQVKFKFIFDYTCVIVICSQDRSGNNNLANDSALQKKNLAL